MPGAPAQIPANLRIETCRQDGRGLFVRPGRACAKNTENHDRDAVDGATAFLRFGATSRDGFLPCLVIVIHLHLKTIDSGVGVGRAGAKVIKIFLRPVF